MNTPITISYRFPELNIGPDQLEKMIGYEPGMAPEPVPGMIHNVLADAEKLADIRGKYVIIQNLPSGKRKDSLRINGLLFQTGKLVNHYISKSEQFIFFVVTAGKKFEMQSQQLMKGSDPLLGYLYDVIGSLTVEYAVEKFRHDTEGRFLKAGLKTTNPYSPGYCGWPVSDQKNLFSLFDHDTCGIELSETCLMDPIKSVSGIMGIGEKVIKQPYSCTICDAVNCLYRDRH